MESFTPLHQRLVIRPDPYPKTVGLLHLPEISQGDAHQRTRTGTVVSMGPGAHIKHGPRMGELWPMPDGKTPELMPDLHGKKVVYLSGTGQHTDIELPFVNEKGELEHVLHHVVFDDVIDAYFADDGALVPIYDRVLVKRHDAIERIGLIWVPDTSRAERYEGTVVSTGPGRVDDGGRFRKLDVQPGDHVIFGKYQGVAIKVDGQPRLMLREDDIFGVVEEEDIVVDEAGDNGKIIDSLLDSTPVPGGP